MTDDFIVPARSTKQIEARTLAWRDAFGVADEWAPDVVNILENRLPTFFPEFALVVRADSEMVGVEAFAEFYPPEIVVRESVYRQAARRDGRSRMTFVHELGHLVLHAGVDAKPRMIAGNKPAPTEKIYTSAEWQARKFASLFLMPTHIVRQFPNVQQLIDGCQVSAQAAQIRFNEVGHIKPKLPDCVQELIQKVQPPES